MEHGTCDEIGTLVELARAGDQAAWTQLYRRFSRLIWKVVLQRLRRHDQAADLVQEVFLRAFRKLPQLREPARFGGWLLKIAQRQVNNWLKRDRPCAGYTMSLGELSARLPESGAALQKFEERLELQQGLAAIDPEDRAALEAFYLHNLTLRQICARTGEPRAALKYRLRQARQRLARLISRCHPLWVKTAPGCPPV